MAKVLTKICSKCNKEKFLLKFNKDKTKKDGLYSSCKDCQAIAHKIYRNTTIGINSHLKANNKYKKSGKGQFATWKYQLKKKFGITPEYYDKLLIQQSGVCAICKKPEIAKYKNKLKVLVVDHNHLTGKIRGLLCNSCNTALGLLRENVNILKNTINYLETNL